MRLQLLHFDWTSSRHFVPDLQFRRACPGRRKSPTETLVRTELLTNTAKSNESALS